MSWQTSSWVAECSRATGNVRLVFMVLANHMGPQGDNAYPSIETLGREAGGRDHPLAKTTVLRAIEQLEESGEIVVYEGAGKSTRGRPTNRYELPHVEGWEAPPGLTPRRPFSSDPLPIGAEDFGSDPADFGSAAAGTLVARNGDFGSAQAIHEQPSMNNPPQSKEEQPARAGLDAAFEAWWIRYPAREGRTRGDKKKTRALWMKLSASDRALTEIAVDHYREATDPQYVKLAEGWLKSRRFDDWQKPGRRRSNGRERPRNAFAGNWSEEQQSGAVRLGEWTDD